VNDKLLPVFQECNSHMRLTEQKHLTVTVAYLGSIGVAIPLVLSSSGNSAALQIQRGAALFVVSTVGLVVYGLQRWYAMWKRHYLVVIKEQSSLLLESVEVNPSQLPLFLRKTQESKEEKVTGSVDQTIDYLTLFLAVLIGVSSLYFGRNGVLQIESTTWIIFGWIFVGGQAAALALVHLILRKHLNDRQRALDGVQT